MIHSYGTYSGIPFVRVMAVWFLETWSVTRHRFLQDLKFLPTPTHTILRMSWDALLICPVLVIDISSAIKGINERQYVVVFNKRRLDKMKLRSSYEVLSAYTFQSSASQCLIIISACPHHIDTSVKSDPSICQIPVGHNALAVFVWVCCVTCLMTE